MKLEIRTVAVIGLACFALQGWAAVAQEDVDYSVLAKRLSLAETASDGAWMEAAVTISDTPEGAKSWRVGDIDNFGQTWRIAHNPLSGEIASRLKKRDIPEEAKASLPKGVDEESYILGLSVNGTEGEEVTDTVFNRTLAESSPSSLEAEVFLEGRSEGAQSYTLQFYLVTSGQRSGSNDWKVALNGKSQPELGRLISLTEMKPRQGYLFSYQFYSDVLDADDLSLGVRIGLGDTGSQTEFAVDFLKVIEDCDTPDFAGTVHGIVRSSGSGRPLPDVLVSCQGSETRTGKDGTFRFDARPAGQAYVCIDGSLENFKTIRLADGETLKTYFAK
ncbi:carboxypeptidase-like regulatory domain-containing protein [Pelagicoccus mobilis]|uniref:Carboxypeptidase regulatory-like domain-containing protein n=1 Tax=Pelagicoccus mobilis TaxID=415221 RepID=A0A934VRV3_9BACT|nr:carboxypeptidase-like regulatory domain-containing protein [Pelagicoccus mobilis]MBK1878003.1 carboxypeptidase regulatory-like domain-containing protein [Pelagicoccus mobilis]